MPASRHPRSSPRATSEQLRVNIIDTWAAMRAEGLDAGAESIRVPNPSSASH